MPDISEPMLNPKIGKPYMSYRIRLELLKRLLHDPEVEAQAMCCFDGYHDIRFCASCESRKDGIDALRRSIMAAYRKETGDA